MEYWQTVGALAIGAALGFVGQAILGFWQHNRTVELTERQFEHARQQDERQHEQSGQEWRRERAYELLTALNEFFTVANDFKVAATANAPLTVMGEMHRKLSAADVRCKALLALVTDEGIVQRARFHLAIAAAALIAGYHLPDHREDIAEWEPKSKEFDELIQDIGDYARSL